MSNPNACPAGRRAPWIPRSRRGWGWTARLGLAMLACACAGAGQAQSLDKAVDEIAELLVARGNLEGQQVLVRPGYFFEMGSERNLLLSEVLAWQFTEKLARHGVEPISRSEDENTAITLQGRWNIESGQLVLSVTAQQAVGAGLNTGVSRASVERRVPVVNIDETHLEPDLKSHGRYVVRQLEKGIAMNASGSGRYRLHMRSFSAPDVANPERFNRYLRGQWRPAFTGSRRFSLEGRDESNGELHSDVFVVGERIEVHLYILDGRGAEVAATTVEMDKKLFPPGVIGLDVTAELAKCAGLVEARRLGDAKTCYEGVRAAAPGDARVAAGVRSGLDRIAGIERDLAEVERNAEDDEAFKQAKRLHTELGYREYLSSCDVCGYKPEAEDLLAEVTKPKVGERFRDCPECPELVVVPSGSFMMGSPRSEAGRHDAEGPMHEVTIERPFAVGLYEVTFEEWDACVSQGGCGEYWPHDEGWGRGRRPVVNVNWEDAKAYVRWLSGNTGKEYRLLNETEWEYVARAGTEGPFHTGATISTEQANYNGNVTYSSGHTGLYRGQTTPVGSFSQNDFGLHDVHGNVWEWVEDCWNDSYREAPSDGSAWRSENCSWRVLRGGSWYNEPWFLRSASRLRINIDYRKRSVGFRVARTLAP